MSEYKRISGPTEVILHVNGEDRRVVIRPADTLLHTLRQTLGLTGTKLGCENGDCGACTVQIDGRPTKSCFTLTVDVLGREIRTIEGFTGSTLQKAFVEHNGFQCGYCTPGFIMNADALIRDGAASNPELRREWLESNICRCTGYENIEKAVVAANESTDSDQN